MSSKRADGFGDEAMLAGMRAFQEAAVNRLLEFAEQSHNGEMHRIVIGACAELVEEIDPSDLLGRI